MKYVFQNLYCDINGIEAYVFVNEQKINIEALYNTYHQRVFNVSLNIVQNVEDAEDIVQEVFIEIHRSIGQFNEDAMLSTWIYRISVNKSLDFLRTKKRKKRFAFITQLFYPDSREPLKEIVHFEHPGVALENKERAEILFKAIEKLPESQKTAFILSQIEKLPQKEIAQIMEISEKAVEGLVQRAKVNLRQQLGKLYYERRI